MEYFPPPADVYFITWIRKVKRGSEWVELYATPNSRYYNRTLPMGTLKAWFEDRGYFVEAYWEYDGNGRPGCWQWKAWGVRPAHVVEWKLVFG